MKRGVETHFNHRTVAGRCRGFVGFALLAFSVLTQARAADDVLLCNQSQRTNAAVTMPLMIEVRVSATGALQWDKAPTTLAEFDERLSQAVEMDPQPVPIITAPDTNTRFAAVEPVFLAIKRHQIHHYWVNTYKHWDVPGMTIPMPIICSTGDDAPRDRSRTITLSVGLSGRPIKDGVEIGWAALFQELLDMSRPPLDIVVKVEPRTPFLQFTELMIVAAQSRGQERRSIRIALP